MMIRVGVRGSKLALAYADRVRMALPFASELIVIKTAGDLNPDTSLFTRLVAKVCILFCIRNCTCLITRLMLRYTA